MLDKSTKAKVVNEDKTFIRLLNKIHLATGPLLLAWSLAEELDCKPVMKHIKKSVLALGQIRLTLNHERRMLSYGEICKDHGKAKEHLKEASDSFAKMANKGEKPPLFGEKFKRAVIDRGTLSKQLKEARRLNLSSNHGYKRSRGISAHYRGFSWSSNKQLSALTPPRKPLGGVG